MSTSNTILAHQTPNRAVQIGLLFALITGLTVPIYGFIAWQLQAWQLWAVAATNFILMAGGLVGFGLARRGQIVRALKLLIGVLVFGALMSVAFVGGIGILGAILVVMLGLSIASQGIPRNELNRTLITIVIAAFVVIGVSFLAQPIQFNAPVLGNFIAVAAVAIVIIFGAFIVRQFGNYPLPTKLLIASLGIVSLALAAEGFVANLVIRNQLTERTGLALKSLATSKAQEIVDLLSREISGLRVLSLNKFIQDSVEVSSAISDGDLQRIEELDARWRLAESDDPLVRSVVNGELADELREYQGAFSDQVEIFITDKFGANLAATNRTSDYYQADEEWWQVAVQNGLYIGQPEYDESANQISIIVAIPIPAHERNEIIGVLRTTLNLQGLGTVLGTGRLGETGRAALYLPTGAEIATGETGQPNLITKSDEEQASLSQLFQSNQNYESVVDNGQTRYVSQAPVIGAATIASQFSSALANLNWRVVASQAETEVLTSIDAASNATLVVVLGALIVAVLLSTWLTQLLTRPITRLTETAAKITSGDLSAQAPIDADDEVGALAATFNVMTTQLRETLEGLEARVSERTRAIAASAEVSRRLSTVLDRQKLVREVVEQVQTAFGYYYVQIYFWDEARENLVMAGGTGEPGQIMLGRGHKLLAGRGLVGRAAETNTAVLVPNTAESSVWLPNLLLPDTRAELAVPIALGDRVLGVLDVQHDTANGLDNEDVEVLQSLANQVAVATQNARTFAQAQRQADVEAMVNTIGQKIQSATTVEGALQVATREVGRALGGTKAVVRLKTSPLADYASH